MKLINKLAFDRLQADILRLQGFKPAVLGSKVDDCLGPIAKAFPHQSFQLKAVHEFVFDQPEEAAATSAFATRVAGHIAQLAGVVVWISTSKNIFPPALQGAGFEPDRILFLNLRKEKDVAAAMEEVLKCTAVTAVISELRDLDFITSRRLQLAVEQSNVTGFVLHKNFKHASPNACVTRWRIAPLPSVAIDNLPGVGYTACRVELLRVRNGKPGVWNVCWKHDRYVLLDDMLDVPKMFSEDQRKVG